MEAAPTPSRALRCDSRVLLSQTRSRTSDPLLPGATACAPRTRPCLEGGVSCSGCLPACLPPSWLRTLCRARLSWLGGGAPARRCWHCAGSCGQTAAASEPRVRARSRGARRPPASVAQQLLLGWWEMAARRVGNAADMQGAGAGIAALLHVVPLYDVRWSWRHGDAPWPDPGVCRAQALDGTCAPSSQHAAWPWRTPDAHVALGFSSTAGRG